MICKFTQATKDSWSQLELSAPQQYTKSVPHSPRSPLLRSSCFSTAFVLFCTSRLIEASYPLHSESGNQGQETAAEAAWKPEPSHCSQKQAASLISTLLFCRQIISVHPILNTNAASSSAARPGQCYPVKTRGHVIYCHKSVSWFRFQRSEQLHQSCITEAVGSSTSSLTSDTLQNFSSIFWKWTLTKVAV